MIKKTHNGDGEILDVRQTAAFLQLHYKTVVKLTKEGKIPGAQVGRSWRFRRADIVKLFEQQPRLKLPDQEGQGWVDER
jgi:excisionase family DNA binding protein